MMVSISDFDAKRQARLRAELARVLQELYGKISLTTSWNSHSSLNYLARFCDRIVLGVICVSSVQLPKGFISQISPVLIQYDVNSVYLFGSRVDGTASLNSDYDLGIF